MNEIKSRLEARVAIDDVTGCWNWTGAKKPEGYGSIGIGKKMYRAHRLSYELYRGDIPKGMFVCHRCDNPACINPDHLFVGTPLENVRDMDGKGRGVRVPRRKLTDEQIRHIKRRELTNGEYAALYKINPGHVSHIWSGRFYPDL